VRSFAWGFSSTRLHHERSTPINTADGSIIPRAVPCRLFFTSALSLSRCVHAPNGLGLGKIVSVPAGEQISAWCFLVYYNLLQIITAFGMSVSTSFFLSVGRSGAFSWPQHNISFLFLLTLGELLTHRSDLLRLPSFKRTVLHPARLTPVRRPVVAYLRNFLFASLCFSCLALFASPFFVPFSYLRFFGKVVHLLSFFWLPCSFLFGPFPFSGVGRALPTWLCLPLRTD